MAAPPRPAPLASRRRSRGRGMLVVNGMLLATFALAVAFFVPMPESRRIGFYFLAGLAALLAGAALLLLPKLPGARMSRAERRRRRR